MPMFFLALESCDLSDSLSMYTLIESCSEIRALLSFSYSVRPGITFNSRYNITQTTQYQKRISMVNSCPYISKPLFPTCRLNKQKSMVHSQFNNKLQNHRQTGSSYSLCSCKVRGSCWPPPSPSQRGPRARVSWPWGWSAGPPSGGARTSAPASPRSAQQSRRASINNSVMMTDGHPPSEMCPFNKHWYFFVAV